MNGELLAILEAIERDKGIDREVLIQAVEGALASAAKKSLGLSEESIVTVTLDRQSGRLSVVSDDRQVSSIDFSRIAAQTAKQVIIQKIREAEREVIFSEFQGRVGDIVTGSVHRFERGDIIVELGRAEAVMPRAERIPHEEYQQGDRLQGYVLEVRRSVKGPAIILSRTHEGFIRGLFALEVPEIAEGIVEIKAIAREPGDRTKIAVASKDEKVDCVGACVGMRGTRVKNIVRELHGEKIDIIRWQSDIKEFIAAALSPAKIAEIRLAAEPRHALVVVDDDQLSLAIGKRGQNVRLASKLTGWELEIQSKSQLAAVEVELRAVPGVGPAMETRLKEAGITTAQELASMTIEQLTAVKSVGAKTAQRLIDAAKRTLETRAATGGAEVTAPPADAPAEAATPQEPAAVAEAPREEPAEPEAAQPTADADASGPTEDAQPAEPAEPSGEQAAEPASEPEAPTELPEAPAVETPPDEQPSDEESKA